MSLHFYLYVEVDVGKEELLRIDLAVYNITHNLNLMADAAGIYKVLWRPEENGFIYAKDIIATLEIGLAKLKSDEKHFRHYDSPNGWGVYENFVPFVEKVLAACKEYPKAKIFACV